MAWRHRGDDGYPLQMDTRTAETGIQEYWVSDLKNSQLRIFRNVELGNYQTQQIVTEGTISPLAFADVVVDVRRLFS